MDALEALRSRNRYDVTLNSGLNVTIRCISMLDAMEAGGLPVGTMEHARQLSNGQADKADELSLEEIQQLRSYQKAVVAKALLAVDGVELENVTVEAIEEMADPDIAEICGYATRNVPLPKVEAQT